MLFKDKNDNTIQVDPLRRLILTGMLASSLFSRPLFWNDKNKNDMMIWEVFSTLCISILGFSTNLNKIM